MLELLGEQAGDPGISLAYVWYLGERVAYTLAERAFRVSAWVGRGTYDSPLTPPRVRPYRVSNPLPPPAQHPSLPGSRERALWPDKLAMRADKQRNLVCGGGVLLLLTHKSFVGKYFSTSHRRHATGVLKQGRWVYERSG
jgi:hypothetical protein